MATNHQTNAGPVSWELLAILRMAALALFEALWGLMSWPFARTTEETTLSYIPTHENQALIAGCPTIRTFPCAPWATGPHAQTFFGVIKLGPRPVPRKELVTMPDGVQITLLWFEPKDAAADAPLVVSLHGIGGDENSVRPIMLAEECMRRGWRSVMYLRRGHGDSSLLPLGAAEAATGPQAAGAGNGGGKAEAVAAPGRTSAGAAAAGGGGNKIAGAAAAATAGAAAPVAVPVAADSPAAACLDLPSPPSSPPPPLPTGAGAVTTVTILATDACDDSAAATDATAPSPAASIGCLPKHFNLPTLPLPLPLPLLGGGGGDAAAGAAASPAAAVDPEALRRTRKAFPQHADTEDFMVVLQHIRAQRPRALMLAVGFSMGSNVLVKFLGEHPPAAAAAAAPNARATGAADGGGGGASVGEQPERQQGWREEDPKNPLAAAISVSNGYDIIEGTRHMVSSRPLADRIITAALHKLLRRKLPEVHAICAAHGLLVDFDEVLSCNTIRDFERALMLPICGLDDLDAYYTHNNCREALMNVRTPLLCLSALDDPIIDPSLLRHAEAAAAANPHVLLAVTRRGGHLGWISGWAGRSWMMDVITQFVESVAELHAAGGGRGGGGGGGGAAGAGAGARSTACPGQREEVRAGAAPGAAGGGPVPGADDGADDGAAAACAAGPRASGGCGTAVAPGRETGSGWRSVDVTASSAASSPATAAAAVVAAAATSSPGAAAPER
ncbi:hypothetical protein PLESTB_000987200 [Pleodorina starrii]|uniref:Serine aminopeptidase S33 domain-containing protein n=1 Tax=Pleodorina starrii TaxID=330485 RepID=A0A9W6F3S0_9CHLO|nr:hypothetical protein PLESTM_000549800 [Pleodorina starrii]GLC55438.1 hypothetical protein PLESTB_000987200 [Pleodorina starrii]GLC73831.1 hypothetical protein PLESTF_001425600 [Pleodorina starrii]